MLWVCHVWLLLCSGRFPARRLLESFYHKQVLSLSKAFSTSVKMIMCFLIQFVNMVYHIDWLVYIKESLHHWEKSHLVMVYDTGFPGGSDGKEFACNVRHLSLISRLGRSPGGGNGNPLQYSCLDNSMDRETWQDRVHRVTKSQTHTTEHLTLSLSYAFNVLLNLVC